MSTWCRQFLKSLASTTQFAWWADHNNQVKRTRIKNIHYTGGRWKVWELWQGNPDLEWNDWGTPESKGWLQIIEMGVLCVQSTLRWCNWKQTINFSLQADLVVADITITYEREQVFVDLFNTIILFYTTFMCLSVFLSTSDGVLMTRALTSRCLLWTLVWPYSTRNQLKRQVAFFLLPSPHHQHRQQIYIQSCRSNL